MIKQDNLPPRPDDKLATSRNHSNTRHSRNIISLLYRVYASWNVIILWVVVLTLCAVCDLWSAFSFGSIIGRRFIFAQNCLILLLLIIGGVFTVGRKGYPLYATIVLLSTLFLCGEMVSIRYFGMKITGDMLMMILGSSPGEMGGFCRQLFLKLHFWTSVVLFSVTVYSVILLVSKTRKWMKAEGVKMRLFGAMCFFFAIGLSYAFQNPFRMTTHFPFYFQCIGKLNDYLELSSFIRDDRKMLSQNIDRMYNAGFKPLICIMIGESATREAWSLYGYPRETTPEMERIKNELIVFQNVTACASHTTDVMKYILTCATPENPHDMRFTLPTLLSCGGYSVSLYSNQEHWGQFDGPITMLFHACKPKIYIKHDVPKNELLRASAYDDDLLQYLGREISTTSDQPAVVFLHLSGSHIAWRDCAPKEYHRYPQAELAINETQETLRNSYDNSIFFTDAILGKAIAKLKSVKRPTCLLYFSDHGDTPSAGKSRDASSSETWNIPAIIWMSEDFKKQCKDFWDKAKINESQPIRSDAFFYMIQEMCGVKLKL